MEISVFVISIHRRGCQPLSIENWLMDDIIMLYSCKRFEVLIDFVKIKNEPKLKTGRGLK